MFVVHFEAILWVRLIVDDLLFSVRVLKRVPAFYMSVPVGLLVSFLRVLVIAASKAELITLWSVQSLREFQFSN